MRLIVFLAIFCYAFGASADALFDRAWKMIQEKNYSKGVPLMEQSAKKGNSIAQYTLSTIYIQGKWVKKDVRKAVYWARKSAEQGDCNGEYTLGYYYYLGLVPLDANQSNVSEAARWLEKSHQHGCWAGKVMLGKLYFNGEGVPQNYEKAWRLYEEGIDLAKKTLPNKDFSNLEPIINTAKKAYEDQKKHPNAPTLFGVNLINIHRTAIGLRIKKKGFVKYSSSSGNCDAFDVKGKLLNAVELDICYVRNNENESDRGLDRVARVIYLLPNKDPLLFDMLRKKYGSPTKGDGTYDTLHSTEWDKDGVKIGLQGWTSISGHHGLDMIHYALIFHVKDAEKEELAEKAQEYNKKLEREMNENWDSF